MELTGTQSLPVSMSAAWAALNDTARLKKAIPGCESIVPQGELRHDDKPLAYDLVIGAAVGPIRARFRGTLRLTDLAPPDRYVLHFEGEAAFVGRVSGSAAIRLRRFPTERRI